MFVQAKMHGTTASDKKMFEQRFPLFPKCWPPQNHLNSEQELSP
jgi:hypothetical protein